MTDIRRLHSHYVERQSRPNTSRNDVEGGEYEIERLYREAAFMLIGEGTSDIQKMIIGRSPLNGHRAT